MIDLHEASGNLASFVQRNGIGPILRGAVLSTSTSVDAHYSPVLSNLSPLFKLPVDAVQRGRDHGTPAVACFPLVLGTPRVLSRRHGPFLSNVLEPLGCVWSSSRVTIACGRSIRSLPMRCWCVEVLQ